MAFGAQLLGDDAREHLIQQQKAHFSPGEQLAFPLPGIFGRVVGGLGRSDLGIDLIGVGGPVADGDTDQAYRDASVLRYQGEQVVFGQARLVCPG
jgi:hypothetical protein